MMARMSRPLENLLTFRSLYDSPLVSVRDYRCRAGCGAPGDEEQPDADQIVLLRSGAFRRHRELAQRLWVVEDSQMEPPLATPDPLWIEVTALQIIADVLEAAFARQGLAAPSCKRRREGTEDDHADHVEAAKTYLASRMSERVTLGDVARAVGTSPFHLARLFRRRTGAPVHRYLMCLRLRASLERLADGANDLTALALELGFSSHSHFTDSFRREFGRTPSDVRRGASRRRLREMSKNLEV